MERAFITMDGASLSVAHVLSFETEKAFISEYENKLYPKSEMKLRKQKLRWIYKQAKHQSTSE
jgi:hypothetical protein